LPIYSLTRFLGAVRGTWNRWARPRRRSSGGIIALAFLPLAALCLALTSCPRQPQVGLDWTPARLRYELAQAGVVYDALPFGGDSLLLLRRGLPEKPPEAFARIADAPRRVAEQPGALLVSILPEGVESTDSKAEGCLRLGRLWLRGHPSELHRVAEALR
jgi:hypothetical protein